MVSVMSNEARRLCSSQRAARSASLRPSSVSRIWTEVSTFPSSASTWAQKPGMSKTSLATSQAAVMSGTEAPVSSFSRNPNVMPERSTMSLTRTVVMISRCSRCEPIRPANRSRSGIGKYLVSAPRRYGSSGSREARTS